MIETGYEAEILDSGLYKIFKEENKDENNTNNNN